VAGSDSVAASDHKNMRRRYQLREYLSPKVLVMLALGFSSGLPFLLVGNTFGFWLSDQGTSLTAIGFISWVGLAYSLKFLWSPLLDRLGAAGAVEPSLTWVEPKEILIPRTIALCHPRRRDPSGSALILMDAVRAQFGV